MKNDWLSATNFERMNDLVLAITTLSLHYKTQLSDMKIEPFSAHKIQSSTDKVITFLEQIQQGLESAASNPDQIVTGTNPRFSKIIIQYRLKKAKQSSDFYQVELDQVIDEIRSVNSDNMRSVIDYLSEIRLMVGESVATDINNLLGEL